MSEVTGKRKVTYNNDPGNWANDTCPEFECDELPRALQALVHEYQGREVFNSANLNTAKCRVVGAWAFGLPLGRQRIETTVTEGN